MKTSMTLTQLFILSAATLTLLTTPAHAVSSALPTCHENMENAPCQVNEANSNYYAMNMLFGNKAGYDKVTKKSRDGFVMEGVRTSLLEFQDLPTIHAGTEAFRSVMFYEILLNDCRNTDTCGSGFRWSVTEKTVSNGYTAHATYEDKFESCDGVNCEPLRAELIHN